MPDPAPRPPKNPEDTGLPLALLRRLAEEHGARAVYLFGSRARGEAAPDADVDLGVLFIERRSLDDLLRFEDRLETELGHDVDLVDVSRCDPFLAFRIIDGVCLYRRDREVDEFELYVLRRAGDLLPFERERQAMLLRPREAGS